MKKKIFIIIFSFFYFTQNSFSYSSDPKEFITEIVEEAKKVALRAVKAAIVRNIGTGDGINIATMDKNGFRLLTDEQKKAVIEL